MRITIIGAGNYIVIQEPLGLGFGSALELQP
jgi:hypothetical protein